MYKDPSKRQYFQYHIIINSFGQVTNVIAFDQFSREGSNTNAITGTKQGQNIDQSSSSSQSSLNGAKGQNKYAQLDDIGYGKNELPPLWVDIQENIEDKIAEAEKQFEKLKTLRVLRFKPKFDEQENIKLDTQIDNLVQSLTQAIKISEKDLRQMMSESSENNSDYQIRKNIQQTYLFKLQDITRQLRQIEKEHFMRVKDLYGEEGEIIINQLEKREKDYFAELDVINDKDQKQRDLIQLDHMGELSEQRSEQITKIVNQINDLAVVFKELSTLVVEQGTVLDRIDFNIEQAHGNVKLANKEFVKTLKREQSWRAKGCMSCQITWIVVCVALLIVKHMG